MDRYREISDLLLDVAVTLMASGSHTSRIVRNVARAADSFGCSTSITIFQKSIIMTLTEKDSDEVELTAIRKINPMPLNFRTVSAVSSLTWEAYDNRMPMGEFREKFYAIKSRPRFSKILVTLLVSLANAAFCRLFTGDFAAMALVFFGTMLGFTLKEYLGRGRTNHLVIFIISAFASSFLTGASIAAGVPTSTPDIAVGSSVLFLIPGVPMINGVIDVLEGHVLAGISRLTNATILIVCITIGISLTLVLLGIHNL